MLASMRLSTSLPYASDIKSAASQVHDLEAAGIDLIWVAEAYGFDGVSVLGYLAGQTETVGLAAGILPIYSRTPTLLAMTAAGLDDMSDGRFELGIGASGPQVIEGFHGVPYDRPLARTREIIEICRKVWAREEPLTYDGEAYQVPLPPGEGTGLGKPLKIINHPVRAEIPIYVAALGEKNVELTAEIADGWLPLFFVPDKTGEVFGASLAAGMAKRDPALGPLDICAGGLVAIGEEKEVGRVRDFARPAVALYVGGMGARDRNFYNALVRRYGYEAAAAEIQDLYLAGKKKEAEAAVPAELLELTNLVGPEGYIKERIAAFQDAGVTVLNVTPVGPDPVAMIEKLKSWTS